MSEPKVIVPPPGAHDLITYLVAVLNHTYLKKEDIGTIEEILAKLQEYIDELEDSKSDLQDALENWSWGDEDE